jgi:hypothetical protein
MDHDHGNDRTPATRCAIGIKPVAVPLSKRAADRYTLICDVPPDPRAVLRRRADL